MNARDPIARQTHADVSPRVTANFNFGGDMLATHESMQLPRLSGGGFHFWRAVELTGRQPRYILSITSSPNGEVDMLFSMDQEVRAFLDTMTSATPKALHVLVPGGWAGSTGWQLLSVVRLDVRRASDTDGSSISLVMRNGQRLRARDLAPVDLPPDSVAMSFRFD